MSTHRYIYLLLKEGFVQVQSEWMTLMARPWVDARILNDPEHTRNVTAWNKYGKCLTTSKQLLNDNISKYRASIAISSHKTWCSSKGVGDAPVLSKTWKEKLRNQKFNEKV